MIIFYTQFKPIRRRQLLCYDIKITIKVTLTLHCISYYSADVTCLIVNLRHVAQCYIVPTYLKQCKKSQCVIDYSQYPHNIFLLPCKNTQSDTPKFDNNLRKNYW